MAEPTGKTIDMRPAPALVRQALAHCEIPLIYTDEHTAELPETDDDMGALLSAVVTVAMVKHLEDTMVLPSNLSKLVSVAEFLRHMDPIPRYAEDIEEAIATIDGVVMNLNPAKR